MKAFKRLKKDLYKKHYANKITEIKGKISGITGLTITTTVLNAVENKIPNVSDLFKKAEYAEISDLRKNNLVALIIINLSMI